MADRADNFVSPGGELVGMDLTDTDGEGTVCTRSEANWYEDRGRLAERSDESPLTKDEVYGADANLGN